MEKILLTCFLALLCLYGSATTARVADSPTDGADLVDKVSGPHRGGETLSDTFPFEEFGLFSRYLDSGAGEETRRLQPAPVTVSTQVLKGKETVREASDRESPGSSVLRLDSASLVDTSTSPRPGGGLRSASEGEAAPVAAFVETRSDTLTIGDQIPSGIEFSEVLQFDSDKLRLDDFRGKYVILEFWAPTCAASVGSLSRLDEIQRKYGQDIKVLPVTIFPKSKISELLAGAPDLQEKEIPLVVDAKNLATYFPHFIIPHVVILNREGKVAAITGIEDLSDTKLDTLLARGKNPFRLKADLQIEIPVEARLLSETPELENKNIWFESAMTGYIPAVGGSLIQRFDEVSHLRIVNMSLLYHYQLAYSEKDLVDYFGRNRIIQEGFNPEELWSDKTGMDYEDWMAEGTHVFGYELIAPKHRDAYGLMREDLKRFFPHIAATVETRRIKVFALVQQEGKSFPRSKATQSTYQASNGLKMTQYPLQGFVYHLNAFFMAQSPYPVMNRAEIDYPIDLELDARLSNPASLKQALLKNGLDLVEREEEVPVLVLRKIAEPKFLMP